MKLTIAIVLAAFCSLSSYAQKAPIKKKVQAQRTATSPKIDGLLDDAVWSTAAIATDFIELRPVPGRVEPKEGRTEIKILYDDYAIYVSARMFDKPDSVVHELVSRDNIGNADFIGVVFD